MGKSGCRDTRLSRQLEKGDENDSWISRSLGSYHTCAASQVTQSGKQSRVSKS